MKKYILAALCLAAATAASAETDATLNRVTETFTVLPDGSIDRDYSKSMTLHTHHAFFNLFGETFVVYNPAFQSLTVNECKTTQSNGNVVNAPANAFNESLPFAAVNSADYNGLREMVITHTGLEPGSTIDLSYTLKTSPDGSPTLDIDRIIGQQGADIREYVITVNVPDGVTVNWSLAGSSVKPIVNGNSYTWTFRNIPAAAGDPYAPVNHTGAPRLSITTAGSLEEALHPLTVETLDICETPAEVLDGADTKEKKIEAIHNFMVDRIAQSDISPTLSPGNGVRQCADVLADAYGTEAEKALAMARLMRAAGIDARTVVVYPKEVKTRSIANISKYLVLADGKFYAPGRKGEYNASRRADRDDYVTLDGKTLDITPAKTIIDAKAVITLANDSLTLATDTVTATGTDATPAFRSIDRASRRGKYTVITIPTLNQGIDAWGMTSLRSRRTDMFELPSPIDETVTVTIRPEGSKSLTPDSDRIIDNAAGRASVTVINNPDGSVTVTRTVSLDKSVYTPAEYPALKALITLWNTPSLRNIIFE